MPSTVHQTLLLWVVRKMVWDGYRVAGYDGKSELGGAWNELAPPPILSGVRPDAFGFDTHTGRVALAEAKTAEDILTAHTRLQLKTYVRIRTVTGEACWLYIAVPRSAAPFLDRVIAEVTLSLTNEIIRVHVPDVLLKGE
jgi:hypothetical protein